MRGGGRRIECLAIAEHELGILVELLHSGISAFLNLRTHSSEVHRVLDFVKVSREKGH